MNAVSFDTETKGFDWWLEDQRAFIATTFDGTDERCFDLSDFAQANAFRSQLLAADVMLAQNFKFDCHQVRATIDLDILAESDAEFFDTEMIARVFVPEGKWQEHGGFGLEALTKHFLGRDGKEGKAAMEAVAKEIGLKTMNATGAYYKCWLHAPEVVERYAKLDARDTWDLYHALIALDVTDGQRATLARERACLPLLIEAERRGTAVNGEAALALLSKYTREKDRLHESLVLKLGEKALGGEGSEKALVDGLLAQGVPLTERTEKSDELSTSKFALSKFTATHPVVAEFLEYRHLGKFLSTYIEPFLNAANNGGVIHPNFAPIGAWTGRMSCRQPNMQNIPVRSGPEVREVIVPRPGYSLVVADFDTIEIRVLAHYLGPLGESFRQQIKDGLDTHAWMASELANRGILPWAAVGQETTPADFAKDGPNGKLRSNARHTLFAIVYGAGGGKLCEQLGLPTGPPLKATDWLVKKGYKQVGEPSNKQGQEVAKAIKDTIPGYKRLMYRIQDQIDAVGYVTTLGGRKQKVDREKKYVGMSAIVQGTAADIMKEALVKGDEVVRDYGDAAHLLMVVHDEGVYEIETTYAEAFGADLATAMESAWPDLDPPLKVAWTVAQDYGSAK